MFSQLRQVQNFNNEVQSIEGAKWITHPQGDDRVLQFKKSFNCAGVTEAILLVCGLGFFDAQLNGKQIDDSYFKPNYTDYGLRDIKKNYGLNIGKKQTVSVHLYDVTNFLQEGENLLEFLVGDGYYHNVDRPEEPFVSYGDKKLVFKLCLKTEKGSYVLASDECVLVNNIQRRSTLYLGYFVDFCAKEEEFVNAVLADAPGGEYRFLKTKEEMLCDVVDEVVYPVKQWETNGNTIYDFGFNHSGGVAFKIKGERGREVKIRFAEVLYDENTLNMDTSCWEVYDNKGKLTRRTDQIETYILSGEVDEVKPLFTWQCYRYAEIVDVEGLEIEDFRSLFIHMRIKEDGSFYCSDESLNNLYNASKLSILDNLHAGVFSDCPHREKRPYTGDGQLIAEMLQYVFDAEPFLDKWLWDIVNSQTVDGFIPYSAPPLGGGGGYAWSYAIVEVAETLYNHTGKKEYLERAYDGMIGLLKFFKAHAVNHIVISTCQPWCLGDWLAPDITEFNIHFMSTLFYYRTADAVERFGRILGKSGVEEYAKLKQDIKFAINDRFFNQKKITYCNGIQGENVLPLAFEIVPTEFIPELKARVKDKYENETNLHIDTGIVATPILIEYLTENGMEDIAFAIMTQKDYPSYSFMLEGETTLCEHWSKRWPDYHTSNSDDIVKGGGQLSHCHAMFGSVVAWLFKRVAGLDFSKICDGAIYFTPRFTHKLTNAKASANTPFGLAEISWENKNGFIADITVPTGIKGVFEYYTNNPIKIFNGETAREIYPSDGVALVELQSGRWKITQ